ncbi:HK97 family phage major capsid protein [Clostridium beijerinckii]|uniref:phage major capsid protein n=1 Tax=Clostridium beijerinckii TaxID=1520 RepID=UPI001F4BED06|nr:phage major capsid protein [Clostridium beijerinckii]NRT34134.1 HK97 family phage major capsid protein [Clostridium beijerinckii]NRT46437.1 HK97 family phage major capsid protein [Clostridium beijerinckii]NRZ19559.1 HK97 family phage major capsid protein [Clostridium beijerinckii]
MKELQEKRNTLLTEMEGLVNKAKQETRAFDETETARVEEIKKEIRSIDATIKAEEEMRSFEVVEHKQEERKGEEEVEEKRSQSEINNEELRAILNGETRADAMNTQTDSQGGIVVNKVLSQEIIKAIKDRSDVYSFFNGTQIKGGFKIPKKATSGVAEWVDENPTTDPVSTVATLDMIELGQNRLYRESAITKQMVNVEGIDLEGFIKDDVSESMTDAVESAIFNGTGVKQPTGVIAGIKTTNKITVATRGTITVEELKKAKAKIKQAVVGKAKWFMNSDTFLLIDCLTDSTGRGLIQPDPTQATGYVLLGLPVVLTDAMATPSDAGAKCLVVLATPNAYHTNTQQAFSLYVYTDSVFTRKGLIGYGADMFMDGKTKNDDQLVGIFNKATA